MSDYIIQMKVSELKPHPINSTIYKDNPDALIELKHSIELNGLLEPITITKSNRVISGHRRLRAIIEMGWEKCDCRLSEFENETIALITLNAYRVKTESEIVNEAELLKTEYSKQIKKGRPLKGEVRDGKNWSNPSKWYSPMYDVTRPMIEASAAAYAKEKGITPRSNCN